MMDRTPARQQAPELQLASPVSNPCEVGIITHLRRKSAAQLGNSPRVTQPAPVYLNAKATWYLHHPNLSLRALSPHLSRCTQALVSTYLCSSSLG